MTGGTELKIAGALTAVQHVQYIQYNVHKETTLKGNWTHLNQVVFAFYELTQNILITPHTHTCVSNIANGS